MSLPRHRQPGSDSRRGVERTGQHQVRAVVPSTRPGDRQRAQRILARARIEPEHGSDRAEVTVVPGARCEVDRRGPVLVAQPSGPQLTAMVIVDPDWVLSLTSPFESTCCVPVQLPCEVQLSETTFVMIAPVAGVETCTEFCVWFAVSAPLPAWVPVPFLVGPCCSATIPGRDDARPALNLTLHLIRRLLRRDRSRLGEPMVETAMSRIRDRALRLLAECRTAVARGLELAVVVAHEHRVLATKARCEARALLHGIALIRERIVQVSVQDGAGGQTRSRRRCSGAA